ncbi:MAG: C10 family peptidase [Bacteroidales bacterium]|nr:C10 family peptidase [Bacteroidales bacterium]
MRYFIISIIIFGFSLSLSAQSMNKTMHQKAEQFMFNLAADTDNAKQEFSVSDSYAFYDVDGNPAVLVFNFEGGGFLLLSAEDDVFPILGYSYKNHCPKDDLPYGFEVWIENVVHQIGAVRAHDLNADERIAKAWEQFHNTPEMFRANKEGGLEPMLHSTWDQGKYYNSACPDDPAGPDKHALTGCVATALGQLMNYFRYPQQGEGYYSYTDPTYGFLECNFSEQYYNWDAMGTNLETYNPDVADFLHHIGVSVDMQYGPNGSGMTNHKGAYTLRTYFGYADTTEYFFRDSIDEAFDWTGMLIDHLNQGIPLYYAGWSDTVFQMGHAFIADGYENSTYFHFNWGWGGSSDGYFNLNSLTPSGSDFTLLHEAIAYATPSGDYPVYCGGQKLLTNLQGCVEDGSGPMHDYVGGNTCEWLIQPDDTISYIEFELIKCHLAPDDELIIYDGPNESAGILTSFTGETAAQSFESSGESVLVRFIASGTETAAGWMLSYHAIKPKFCDVIETVTDSTRILSDGSNSYPYQQNTYCNWFIQPDGAENIRIEIMEMDIADGDELRITDRSTNTAVASLSGTIIPESFDIYSDDVSVTFDSDWGDVAGGWKLSYAMNVVSVPEILRFAQCELAPNPTSEGMYLHIYLDAKENLSLQVVSLDGKQVFKQNIDGLAGYNRILIPIETYDAGLYFLQIKGSKQAQTLKLQKL